MEQTKAYDLKKVSVIGLGYVGLPLAVRCQERGYEVIGVDVDGAKIDLLASGKQPFSDEYLEENFALFPLSVLTTDPSEIREADVHLIAVPTPVDALKHPDLTFVIGATEMVASHTKKGALVVLESTVNPYVSEEVIKPIFE